MMFILTQTTYKVQITQTIHINTTPGKVKRTLEIGLRLLGRKLKKGKIDVKLRTINSICIAFLSCIVYF